MIDVGGNIGLFAMYAAKRCVRGKVFTLEPIPSVYRAMVRTLREPIARADRRLVRTRGDRTRTPASVAIGNRGNNSMDDADFGDVFGRQLPARDYPEANVVGSRRLRNSLRGSASDGGDCVFLENDIDGFRSRAG